MAKNEKILDEHGIRLLIRLISGIKSNSDLALSKCIDLYDSTKVYNKNDICVFDNKLWLANTVVTNTEPSFTDTAHWISLDDEFNEIGEQDIEDLMQSVSESTWDYLKNILSDQISTTHAWNSSTSYAQDQATLQSAKDYTDQQVSKSLSKSYVVVNDLSLVQEDKYIYLVEQGDGSYLSYVLGKDGNPISFGDPNNVNLEGYAKTEDIAKEYAKSSDLDSKFATITTTDGLRTDFDNHTNDTVAHLTQEAKDKLVTTDDIITTLDNTATDEQLASALATYKALDDKNIYHFSSPTEGDANTLVIKGKSVHYQISNAVITSGTIANLPPNIGVGGLLISHGLATVHQFFLTHNNRVYKRYGYWANTADTEPTWVGTWERVISEGDLNRTVNGNGDIRIEIPANADMNNYTTAGFYKVLSGSNAITIANLPINNACLINIYGNSNSATGWMVQEIIADNSIVNNRYIRYKIQNNADWSPWEKIVTTRVKNVPLTTLTFSDETNYKVSGATFSNYEVRNGICYVSLYYQCMTPVATSDTVNIAQLPAPNRLIRTIVPSWSANNVDFITSSFANTDSEGNLYIQGGVAGKIYLTQFSYPVKES